MFEAQTRLRRVRLPALTRPTGGGLTQTNLPQVGILSAIYLAISGAVSGTLSNPNALGFASILRGVRLGVNTGIDIFNMGGGAYHWLYRDFIDLFAGSPVSVSNARAAVTAAAYDASMLIPVALNNREETGLLLLQNRDTTATLFVDWEADASVATGATVTGTVTPIVEYFEVPADPKALPNLRFVHRAIEESQAVAAGDVTYQVPQGGILAGLYALTVGTTWTRSVLRAQSGNVIEDHNPASMGLIFERAHPGQVSTLAGGAITGQNVRALYDFLGSDGMGSYGSFRDMFDTARLTSLEHILTVAGAGTLRTVRREILPLG